MITEYTHGKITMSKNIPDRALEAMQNMSIILAHAELARTILMDHNKSVDDDTIKNTVARLTNDSPLGFSNVFDEIDRTPDMNSDTYTLLNVIQKAVLGFQCRMHTDAIKVEIQRPNGSSDDSEYQVTLTFANAAERKDQRVVFCQRVHKTIMSGKVNYILGNKSLGAHRIYEGYALCDDAPVDAGLIDNVHALIVDYMNGKVHLPREYTASAVDDAEAFLRDIEAGHKKVLSMERAIPNSLVWLNNIRSEYGID